MGIISMEKVDHLYWLGRYTERVYTTLRVFFHIYDRIIEQPEGMYAQYCHYFALRCVPGDSLRQKITLGKCLVTPADYTSASSDGFGNLKISGCCRAPHDTFGYCIAGTQRIWKKSTASSATVSRRRA